jgi:hypothetical protein
MVLSPAKATCVGENQLSCSERLSRPTNCITSEAHSCSAFCSGPGTCQIDTAPVSVKATFTGRHETFQYTKVSATRLSLVLSLSHPISCTVYTRFVRGCLCSSFLTREQLQSGCDASRPLNQDKCHTRVFISMAKKSRFSTFAKLGMQSWTRYSANAFNKGNRIIVGARTVATFAPCLLVRSRSVL